MSCAVGAQQYCECQEEQESCSLHVPSLLFQSFLLLELPQLCELGGLLKLLQALFCVIPTAKLNLLHPDGHAMISLNRCCYRSTKAVF